MKISKLKIYAIILIICPILFKYIVLQRFDSVFKTYESQTIASQESDPAILETNYDPIGSAEKLVTNVVSMLQKDTNSDYSKYFDDAYYTNNVANNKADFVQKLTSKIIMQNPSKNYHYISYRTEFKNQDDLNVYIFDVLVLRQNMYYPDGYNILQTDKDIDATKRLDVHVVEYSPNNFKIIFPSITVK